MRVHYYYHISKTGGTSVLDFFKHVANHVPRCRLYDFNDWDNLSPTQKDIDFDSILARDNLAKYDHVLIHHHHGYRGLMHYEAYLCAKKKELARDGHTMKIFTTIRDVVSFNRSRLNYLVNTGRWSGPVSDFTTNEIHFNTQTKYLFFCWHGEWPSAEGTGPITIDVVNQQVHEKNIDRLSDVIDLFVEISHLSDFIKAFAAYFQTPYDYSARSNATLHRIQFDPLIIPGLLRNNSSDCYLIDRYRNKDFSSEVDHFLAGRENDLEHDGEGSANNHVPLPKR